MIKNTPVKIALLAGLIALGGMASAKSDTKGEGRAAMFNQIDANGDGAVTPAEMTAHMAARFAAADADGDGFLTPQEMQAQRGGKRAARMLERHDTNGDGTLDAAELEAAGDTQGAKRGARMMDRLDADDDGKLSLAEMSERPGAGRMFDKLDADGNGSLSASEFASARQHGGMGHKKRNAD